jgi:hypothetical protein
MPTLSGVFWRGSFGGSKTNSGIVSSISWQTSTAKPAEFTLAAMTGLRAGELLALTVADVDFSRLMICPREQADDRTRVLRDLKTKKSRTPVPITQETATVIRAYFERHWKENPQGLLFPNRKGRPWKRAHVVKFGLWPVLKELGLPTHHAGLRSLTLEPRQPSFSGRCDTRTSKPLFGSTSTRTLTCSAQRWPRSNRYKCSYCYKLLN